jgi:hypothetical protein
MKISKKVVIRRNPEQVWSCLTNIKNIDKKSAKNQKSTLRKNSVIKIKGHKDQWLVTNTIKTRKLKLHRRTKNTNVDIDIELIPMKTRTELKLTLSGWENADPETIKLDIPQTSLNWEKTLSRLKKSAEAI